jgi:hypothetical protein
LYLYATHAFRAQCRLGMRSAKHPLMLTQWTYLNEQYIHKQDAYKCIKA